ncbi:MAG: glycosyltransferase family 2 protein [Anaerorhabdus sp.]|uniref:glycosyltransferase family 2 protein n=1 Tax=Anaerorhabdus sp. TaxID=1872524 RepID=UPI002FCAFBD6
MSVLSIVVPVYYNEDNLIPLYNDLYEKVLTKLDKEDDYEIVMVDDGSQDNSWNVMSDLAKKDNKIHCIRLSRNFGEHAANLCGFSNSIGDCAVLKAADLQEPSEIILEMFESWKKGNNVVLAVRKDREEGFSQKLFSNTYYWLVRKLALKNMPKTGFDRYLLDRKVIKALELLDEKNSSLQLQILWCGFKTDCIYYVRKQREIGKSKWTLAKKVKLVVDSLVSFSFAPIKFITFIGFASFVLSCIWGIKVLIDKFTGKIAVAGYTSLAILILAFSGLILLTLGILGEYIWRSMDASRNRPVYIVEEEDLNRKK